MSYRELQEYDRALISTGNYAGTTAGALADLTERVGEATGEFSESRAAAVELATSGKLAGTVLEDASRAAVNLARLTGAGISSTTADIIKLADAPSEHLAKLNEQYHFLSAATYEQIRALEKQGKTQDAVALSIAELARVTDQRTQEMEARAGSLERAWKAVGDTVAGIWQGMKDLGRDDDEYLLAQARKRLANAETVAAWDGYDGETASVRKARDAVRAIEDRITATRAAAEIAADMQRDEEAAIKASQEQEKAAEEARKKAERERESAARARVAAAERLRSAADAEIAGMQRQIELGEKATNVARTRYEVEHGAYRALDGARQQALLREAARLDAAEAARKAGDDYKALLEDLQTKEERLTAQMRERMSVLDAARASGAANDGQYTQAAGRIAAGAFEKAPEVGKLSGAGDVRQAERELDQWYQRELRRLEQYRQERADLNAQWDLQEIDLFFDHQERQAEIARQSAANYDALWSQTFDRFASGIGDATASALFTSESLSDGLRNLVVSMGQQVVSTLVEIGVKRVALIMLDKVAATSAAAGYVGSITSQSAAQTAMAGLNAFSSTAAIPVVGPAMAPAAAAAAIAAATPMASAAVAAASGGVIAGMAHDGIGRVPAANEGTWLLKKDEMVLNPKQADSFGVLLDFVQSQRQAADASGSAGGSGGASRVTLILRNEGGQALEAREVGRSRIGEEEIIEIVARTRSDLIRDVVDRGEFAQAQEGIYRLQRSGR